ncbi:MAG: hypothetical protein A3K61_02465 [Thaumarchaeota archaeon RBG_16_49_8]|nr:MAG: hypothetical protein A3K61_02465 [Thaumarchaeota archaeon RBG_16_49_8]
MSQPVYASHCTIIVSSTPPGANVYLDGAFMGRSPVTYVIGHPDLINVTVILEGYEKWSQTVNVPFDAIVPVDATLSPLAQSMNTFTKTETKTVTTISPTTITTTTTATSVSTKTETAPTTTTITSTLTPATTTVSTIITQTAETIGPITYAAAATATIAIIAAAILATRRKSK